MKKFHPLKAIRKKCLECQGNRYSLIRNCEDKNCPLYPFRIGEMPRDGGYRSINIPSSKLPPAGGSFVKTQ